MGVAACGGLNLGMQFWARKLRSPSSSIVVRSCRARWAELLVLPPFFLKQPKLKSSVVMNNKEAKLRRFTPFLFLSSHYVHVSLPLFLLVFGLAAAAMHQSRHIHGPSGHQHHQRCQESRQQDMFRHRNKPTFGFGRSGSLLFGWRGKGCRRLSIDNGHGHLLMRQEAP